MDFKQREWTTIVDYVDLSTGEVIPKEWVGKYYHKVKKFIKIPKFKDGQKFKIRYITFGCSRHSPQGSLWGED